MNTGLVIIAMIAAYIAGFIQGKKQMRGYLTKEHEQENEMFYQSKKLKK